MKVKKGKRVLLTIVLSVVGVLLIVNLFFAIAPQFGGRPDKDKMAELANASNFSNGRFQNTEKVPVMLPKSFGKLLKQSRKNKKGRTPEQAIPSVKAKFSEDNNDTLPEVIWLGHSSVLIRIDGKIILTDPVFSKRSSPVQFAGPKKFAYTVPVFPEELPTPDIILISHDHFDHLDYKTIKNHYKQVPLFITPLGVGSHLKRWGIQEEQIVEFDWWQEKELVDGIRFVCTPAQHFSGRKKQDFRTLWSSWVIEAEGNRILFSGDSGYGDHFSAIGEKYGPFNLVLMECGAYGKFWPYIHMKPEESVQAAIDSKAEKVIPIHWAKFNLAFHSWTEPVERFIAAAEHADLVYHLPKIGEAYKINAPVSTGKWWFSE